MGPYRALYTRLGVRGPGHWGSLTVAGHDSVDDCQLLIHNAVYDVTHFAPLHPGFDRLLYLFGGSDATEPFEDVSHSPQAIRLMRSFAVPGLSLEAEGHPASVDRIINPPAMEDVEAARPRSRLKDSLLAVKEQILSPLSKLPVVAFPEIDLPLLATPRAFLQEQLPQARAYLQERFQLDPRALELLRQRLWGAGGASSSGNRRYVLDPAVAGVFVSEELQETWAAFAGSAEGEDDEVAAVNVENTWTLW
jgi:hypothetical protein